MVLVINIKKNLLGLYEKAMPAELSLKGKLFAAKKAGFDFMEISIDETEEKLSRLNFTKQQRLALIQDMYEAELPIKTMCLSGHRKYPLGALNNETRERGMRIMFNAVDFACDLGIRIIQLAGYDVYYENSTSETEALFAENLKKSVDYAASREVMLAFETMETPFMDTVKKAMRYVNLIDSPYLKIYPDIGNLTNASKIYGGSVTDDIALGKGNIAAAHLKETAPGKYRDMSYGEGHVDFKACVNAFNEQNVNCFVAEFWHDGGTNWEQRLINSREYLELKGIKEMLIKAI